jgi:CBS-domain-containing membrane protein
MQVKDLMINNVIFVNPDTKVIKVAGLLMEHRIHGLPVVDENQKVVGVITESDFFIKSVPNLYLPSYIEFLQNTKIKDDLPSERKEEIEKLISAQARDIMTSPSINVYPETEFNEVMKIFIENHLYTLPVVDHENKLLGIVTQADVIQMIKV